MGDFAQGMVVGIAVGPFVWAFCTFVLFVVATWLIDRIM
jgi:hypothetical protein